MLVGKKTLISALLVSAVPLGWAIAQGTSPGADPGMGRDMGRGRGGPMRNLSPETMERLQEGRIAMAKAALKLNDAQLKLWGPVEEQMRQRFADRQKRREERRREFEARRANAPQAKQDQPAPLPSMADRLDRRSQMLTQGAERLRAYSAAFKPFYDSLSPEQKQVAEVVMRDMRGGRGGGHHRWAMRGDFRGPGPGRGPRPGMNPDAPPAPAPAPK